MSLDSMGSILGRILSAWHEDAPLSLYIIVGSLAIFLIFALLYLTVYLIAPLPRPPFASEVTYRTVSSDGKVTDSQRIRAWDEETSKERVEAPGKGINEAEMFLSLVVPAYNEEERLVPMLEEAVQVLNSHYGKNETASNNVRRRKNADRISDGTATSGKSGWEILVISDGSTDQTEAVTFEFAKSHPGGSIRVMTLKKNRGKGGAVAHGMRFVRGQYVVFADADGASKFSDVHKLVEACDNCQDDNGRGVAVGSRAHLVGSAAVVNRSMLRNFLMHGFHLLIWMFTTSATSRIRDTQCGFKMFTRQSLPFIVPHMYSEGWIFDVEMLMLAERAKIPMVEVPVGWHEVNGSKLNVLWDSIGMAWSLAVLRAAWLMGVYQTQPATGSIMPGKGDQILYSGWPKTY